jgi:hypothetical protein
MTYRKGDYVLQQSEYNNHYMIIHDNGEEEPRMVLHASCSKPLTEKEAMEAIDFYLRMKNERENNG